jgi:site-specific DNA recombinase
MITCVRCRYRLIGERQKGNVYYRCHTRHCQTHSIRENAADSTIHSHLLPLGLTRDEAAEMKERAVLMLADDDKHREDQVQAVNLQIQNVSGRLSRLMDVYLDGAVDRQAFEEKKLALLMERKSFEQEWDRLARGEHSFLDGVLKYLELMEMAPLSYKSAIPGEKRRLIKTLTSNFFADGKNVVVELKSPFREVSNLNSVRVGGPLRDRPRTFLQSVFDLLVEHCKAHPEDRQHEDDFPVAA